MMPYSNLTWRQYVQVDFSSGWMVDEDGDTHTTVTSIQAMHMSVSQERPASEQRVCYSNQMSKIAVQVREIQSEHASPEQPTNRLKIKQIGAEEACSCLSGESTL